MTTPTHNKLTRRGAMALGLGLCAALPAYALSETAAKALVQDVVSDINQTIARGGSLSSMVREFEKIFSRYADVGIIAQSTLGADARRASPAQMRAYTEAFRGYIARKYGKRFQEFVGGKVEVTGVRQVKTWQEVIGAIQLKGRKPFEVKFLVSDRSGRNLFFDIVIEGISMRLSEKTEIGSILDANRGDIDALIKQLRSAG